MTPPRRSRRPAASRPRAVRRAPGAQRAFTLVELLTATALFAVLGVLLFGMVRSALDVWAEAEANRELDERAQAVLDVIGEDLRHVWAGVPGAVGQRARLLCAPRRAGERSATVLRFTRLAHAAGDAGDATLGLEDARDAADAGDAAAMAALAAAGGLAESLYTTVEPSLLHDPGGEARAPVAAQAAGSAAGERGARAAPEALVLVRCARAGAGGAGSLLAPELAAQPDRWLPDAVVLARGVLHFGCAFDDDLPVWDSTRGVLDAAEFAWGLGPASLLDGRDDVFPRRVTVTLVLDDGEAPWRLAEPLGELAPRLVLAGGVHPAAGACVLVDDEWMVVGADDGETARGVPVVRGARGSRPAAHEAGAAARTGREFSRSVLLPAHRERLGP